MYAADTKEEIPLHSKESIPTMVADRLEVPQWKVWFTLVQVNKGRDPMRKLTFCKFQLSADVEVRLILRKVLWANLFNNRVANHHNVHFRLKKMRYIHIPTCRYRSLRDTLCITWLSVFTLIIFIICFTLSSLILLGSQVFQHLFMN